LNRHRRKRPRSASKGSAVRERRECAREARPNVPERKGLTASVRVMLWQPVCHHIYVISLDGGRVALNSVEKFGKGKPNSGWLLPFDLFFGLGGDSPKAPKDKATPVIRPRPQDRQRSSTACKESACTTGRAGLTGRKDRANDRCLFFAGRRTVSTPTRDSSVVPLDPSQEPTKALPRHLSVHKTPSHITQNRSRAATQPAGDILSRQHRSCVKRQPDWRKSPTDRPRYTRRDVPGATEPESKLGAAIQSSAAPGTP